jgi:hypothetical protein
MQWETADEIGCCHNQLRTKHVKILVFLTWVYKDEIRTEQRKELDNLNLDKNSTE